MSVLLENRVIREYVPTNLKSLREQDMEVASSLIERTSYLHYWWQCLMQWLGFDSRSGYILGTETQCIFHKLT